MERESGNIMYFCLNEGASAKKHIWSPTKLPVVEIDMGEGRELVCCRVPEYYVGRKSWESEKLLDSLSGVLAERDCREYYLQPRLGRMAGVEERLPSEILLHLMLRRVPCWEYLFYIGWEDRQEAEGKSGIFREEAFGEEQQKLLELLECYLPRINHFILVTDGPEEYADFTEYIYEEYGIPTACTARMERRFGRDGKTVILDGRKEYKIPYSVIPEGAAYVDFWSEEEKGKILERMRRDVRYMSAAKFLDTLVKNGYNTIVNQTYM